MKQRTWFIGLLLAFAALSLKAQTILSPDDFYRMVAANHPLIKRSVIGQRQADAEMLRARGQFDPKLESNLYAKQLGSTNYYNLFSASLKVPTWVGAELKVRYDYTNGDFVNPENLAAKGLATVGISMPVLQGLLIDERRTEWRLARLSALINDNRLALNTNELLHDAAAAYWNWSLARSITQIYERSHQLAEERLRAIKSTFSLGDRPAIDTLEASLIVQDRLYLLNDALLALANARLEVDNFLWDNEERPLRLPDAAAPIPLNVTQVSPPDADSLEQLLSALSQAHPELLEYNYKLQSLRIERRLKAEKLKPKLNIEYNLLAKQFGYFSDNQTLFNNYKYGLTLALPIPLRSERANLQLADLKIQDTQLQLEQKQLTLANKVRTLFNKLNTAAQQLKLYTQASANYLALFEAETARFSMGESSLFLLNSRELKYLDAQQKLMELHYKYIDTGIELTWAMGQLR